MQKDGWAALEGMANDPDSPHRFKSIELIGAYAYGKPTQPVGGDLDPDSPPLRVSVTFDHANQDADPD